MLCSRFDESIFYTRHDANCPSLVLNVCAFAAFVSLACGAATSSEAIPPISGSTITQLGVSDSPYWETNEIFASIFALVVGDVGSWLGLEEEELMIGGYARNSLSGFLAW